MTADGSESLMTNCHEMRTGQVYTCEECGVELQILKPCKESATPAENCDCAPCAFSCCGKDLKLKA